MATLDRLEQKVFGAEDHSASLEERLKKLELKIMGRSTGGPFRQRLIAVENAVKTGTGKGSSANNPSSVKPSSQIATNAWASSSSAKPYSSQIRTQYPTSTSSAILAANNSSHKPAKGTGSSSSQASPRDLYLDTGSSQQSPSQRPSQGHADSQTSSSQAQNASTTEPNQIASAVTDDKAEASTTVSTAEHERRTRRESSERSDEGQKSKWSSSRIQAPDMRQVASAAKKLATFLPLVKSVPGLGSIAAPVASAASKVAVKYDGMNASEILRQIQGLSAASESGSSSSGEQRRAHVERPHLSTDRPIQDKWALVIGISNFQDKGVPSLRYAAKDAQDFANFLVTDGGFAKDHVRLLLNQEATFRRVLSELGDKFLPRVAKPDDLVVVYFSGHGSPGSADVRGKSYLVVYDTEKSNLYASGLEIQGLAQVIKDRVDSDRVCLVLDACHSGAASTGAKSGFGENEFSPVQVFQGTGQLVICSSSAGQQSWESKRYNNGVFTGNLIKALKSQGPRGSLGEAFESMKDSVANEVKQDDGVSQTPVLKSDWNGNALRFCAPPAEPRSFPQDVKEILQADSKSKP
jgi:hypothetical protein